MEATLDRHWLLGEPRWWNLSDEDPPDFRRGELAPPEDWLSTTPRIGNFGWCRQRLRPLAWALLRPMAWAPFFLAISAIPLAFPGRSPDDQALSLSFFLISWSLVILPILLARNSQPMSDNSLFSLPLDWASLSLAIIIFPFHSVYDSRIGWASYLLFWIAYIRTVQMVQKSMRVPPARFLIPILPEDWKGELPNHWQVLSPNWSRSEIAHAIFENGRFSISGTSRNGQDFLSLAFIHNSGFVQDPFHESLLCDPGLSDFIQSPIPVLGKQWPSNLLPLGEEE